MGAFLIRGMSLRTILAQYMARKTGATRGKDGNMHMGDMEHNLIAFVSMLGDNVPVAAGIGLVLQDARTGSSRPVLLRRRRNQPGRLA